MTRSSQQTYIQRLGFQDKDRANPRHGLACEYLLDRHIEQSVFPKLQELKARAINYFLEYSAEKIKELNLKYRNLEHKSEFDSDASNQAEYVLNVINKQKLAMDRLGEVAQTISEDKMKKIICASLPSSQFISVPISSGKFVNGFADFLFDGAPYFYFDDDLAIKVTLESNYRTVLGEVKITPEPAENIIQQIAFYREFVCVNEVIILVDYDAPQLKRMTENSDIKVYRLGARFDEWCAMKTNPAIEEF